MDFTALYTDPGFINMMRNLIVNTIPAPQMHHPPPAQPNRRQSESSTHSDDIRHSTPNNERRDDQRPAEARTNLTGIVDQMAISTPRTPSAVLPLPNKLAVTPTYIPVAEQALHIHTNAAQTAENQARMYSDMAEFMALMTRSHPNPPSALPAMADNFARQAIIAEQEAKSRKEGLKNARQITAYYETPIARPTFPTSAPRFPVKVNHKELLMLTGYFDPSDKSADFKHTWQKLLDYGTMNDFQEQHYLQALGSILRGEAYEIFTEYKQLKKSLEETLDYFAGVYTKKRSLAEDRKAVDEFTRRKGESIIVCMERAILAIDKLRNIHPASGWEALRQQMRQNILMQVVREETKRAIQMEVDNVHEDTGMPYDFDKLIRFADRYERNHNAQPKEEVTTIFKVASGGIKQPKKRSSSHDQVPHLKKDLSWQKQFNAIQAELKEIKSNEARYYKNEGRGTTRESRRSERDSRSRTDRSQSFDRMRGLTSSSSAPRPSTTPAPTSSSQPPPTTPRTSSNPARPAYSPPDPYARREQSRSPPRRNQTPYVRDSSRPRPSSYSRDRYRPRSYSRDRDQPRSESRPYSRDRAQQSSSSRPYSTDRDRSRNYSSSRRDYSRDRGRSSSRSRYDDNNKSSSSRPHSRSQSAGGTELVSNSGSKTVIITINGQEYIPLRKEN
jgi:hypothetical protein